MKGYIAPTLTRGEERIRERLGGMRGYKAAYKKSRRRDGRRPKMQDMRYVSVWTRVREGWPRRRAEKKRRAITERAEVEEIVAMVPGDVVYFGSESARDNFIAELRRAVMGTTRTRR